MRGFSIDDGSVALGLTDRNRMWRAYKLEDIVAFMISNVRIM